MWRMGSSFTTRLHSGVIRGKVQHYDYAVGRLKLHSLDKLLRKERNWLTLCGLPIAALVIIEHWVCYGQVAVLNPHLYISGLACRIFGKPIFWPTYLNSLTRNIARTSSNTAGTHTCSMASVADLHKSTNSISKTSCDALRPRICKLNYCFIATQASHWKAEDWAMPTPYVSHILDHSLVPGSWISTRPLPLLMTSNSSTRQCNSAKLCQKSPGTIVAMKNDQVLEKCASLSRSRRLS